MSGFFLSEFHTLTVATADERPIKRAGVPGIIFLLPQLPMQFTDADIGIPAMIVADSGQFSPCVCVGMPAVRPMQLALVCRHRPCFSA